MAWIIQLALFIRDAMNSRFSAVIFFLSRAISWYARESLSRGTPESFRNTW